MTLLKNTTHLLQSIKRSLLFKFGFCLILIMTIPFLFQLWRTGYEVSNTELQRAEDLLSGSLQIISQTVDYRLTDAEQSFSDILLDASFSTAVRELADYQVTPTYDDFKNVRTIKNALTETAVKNEDIANIYLYSDNTSRLFLSNINWDPAYHRYDISEDCWYQTYEEGFSTKEWFITTALESDDTILTSYRTIRQFDSPVLGILSLNISASTISSILQEANPYDNSICFLMDEQQTIIAADAAQVSLLDEVVAELPTDQTEGFSSTWLSGELYYWAYIYSDYSNFTFVLGVPASELLSTTSSIRNLIGLYIFNSTLVILIFILLVFLFFIRPIRALSMSMGTSQKGNFSIRLPETRDDEIGTINRSFNQMNQSIHQLIEENYVVELNKRDTELRLLSNQINEHFLYNTLDSIHWLARRHGDEEVGKAVQSLASFYRISLSGGADTITPAHLKTMLENYLYIQQMRMGDHMRHEMNFDANLPNIPLPKYLFIPLLENAIGHGLRGIEDGVLCVSLTQHQDCLRFSVTDNGHGISAQRLAQIKTILQQSDSDTSDCFALKNLNVQLSLYFHNSEGIHLDSKEGFGTAAWFEIPLRKEESV